MYGGLHQRLRYFPPQAVEELQQALDLLSGGRYRAASAAFEAIMRAPGPLALLQKARRGREQAAKGVALSTLSPEELLRMLSVRCARGCVGARRDLGVGRIAALQHVSPTSYLFKVRVPLLLTRRCHRTLGGFRRRGLAARAPRPPAEGARWPA